MRLALAIFASQKCSRLILGAYGCGVFRNDPKEAAAWWRQLLEEFFPDTFQTVIFAVLDNSASQSCIAPFHDIFSYLRGRLRDIHPRKLKKGTESVIFLFPHF